MEYAGQVRREALGRPHRRAGRAAHQQQSVDWEKRVRGQRHTVSAGEARHVGGHVVGLGRHGGRRGVACRLEHTAEQHRPVDQLGAGSRAQRKELD